MGLPPSRLSFSFKAQPSLIPFHDISDSVGSHHRCPYILTKLHMFQKYMYMLVPMSLRLWIQQPVYQVKCRKCLVNAAWLNTITFPFLFTRQPLLKSSMTRVPGKICGHGTVVPTQGTGRFPLGCRNWALNTAG